MSNIQIYNEKNQSLGEVSFLKSVSTHVKIRNADGYELSKNLSHWIAEVSLALGIKDSISDFNKKDLVEMILSRFKNLSVDELYYAFKLERYGQLDPEIKDEPWVTPHYQLFNAEYVAKVLKKYVSWKRKMKTQHSIEEAEKQPTATEQEKKYWINKGVRDCLDFFIKNGYIEDGKTYIYDILYDDGHLPTNADFKKKMYSDAKEVLRFEYESKKPANLKEKKEFKNILSEIEAKQNSKVVLKAKEIILNNFFRKLIKNEKEVEKFKSLF